MVIDFVRYLLRVCNSKVRGLRERGQLFFDTSWGGQGCRLVFTSPESRIVNRGRLQHLNTLLQNQCQTVLYHPPETHVYFPIPQGMSRVIFLIGIRNWGALDIGGKGDLDNTASVSPHEAFLDVVKGLEAQGLHHPVAQ